MRSFGINAFDIYDVEPITSTILLKGSFRRASLEPGRLYRLYQRFVDFTVDKAITTLQRVDQRGEESIFVVSEITTLAYFHLGGNTRVNIEDTFSFIVFHSVHVVHD
jgi:hypothetical protein